MIRKQKLKIKIVILYYKLLCVDCCYRNDTIRFQQKVTMFHENPNKNHDFKRLDDKVTRKLFIFSRYRRFQILYTKARFERCNILQKSRTVQNLTFEQT